MGRTKNLLVKLHSMFAKMSGKIRGSKVAISAVAAVAAMVVVAISVCFRDARVSGLLLVGTLVFVSVLLILSVNRYRLMAHTVLCALTVNTWIVQEISGSLEVGEGTLFNLWIRLSSSVEPWSLTVCFLVLLLTDLFDRRVFPLLDTVATPQKMEELGKFFLLVESIFKADSQYTERLMKMAVLLKTYPGYEGHLRKAAILCEADSDGNLRLRLGDNEDYAKMALASQQPDSGALENISLLQPREGAIVWEDALVSKTQVAWRNVEDYFIKEGYEIVDVHGDKVIVEPGKNETPRCSVRISRKCSATPSAVVIRPFLMLIERVFGVKIDDILGRSNQR